MSDDDKNNKSTVYDIGTRILQKNDSVPSLFDSDTVIRTSFFPGETLAQIATSKEESKSHTPTTQVQSTQIIQNKKSQINLWNRFYSRLNHLTSLSHWTGRIVWITAVSALGFMIFLNTTPVSEVPSRAIVPRPMAQPPLAAPVTQIKEQASLKKPTTAVDQTIAQPRMKVEFLVHLHELIDKSQRFAPDYTP